MRNNIRHIIAAFLCTIVAVAAYASPSSKTPEVSFIVVEPGPEVFELEGHAALRINGGPMSDFMVTYGVFDFDSPNFIYRFVKGDAEYSMGIIPWRYVSEAYRREGRTLMEYPLALDSVATARLMEMIYDNYRPENRYYRYNYVLDNCVTRPLRIVELAIGDSIIVGEPASDAAADRTFRQVMRRYHKNYPWYQFGIDIALGSAIDREINSREKTFAPVVVADQLPGATAGGRPISGEGKILQQGKESAILGPTPWFLTPDAVFWMLFVICTAITIRDIRRGRSTRWLDTALFGTFGLAGLLLTFLIFVSLHEATSPNWLYGWLNPFCLIAAVGIWIKKWKNAVICYQFINFAVLIALCLLWPLTAQAFNTAFIPLVGCDLMRSASYIYVNKIRK